MNACAHIGPVEADAIYAQLVAFHAGRSEADSMRLNARLILLLINQVADATVIHNLIETAGSAELSKDFSQ